MSEHVVIKKYETAHGKILVVYDHLSAVIDVVDEGDPHYKKIDNLSEIAPIAQAFAEKVTDSTDHIHTHFMDHIEAKSPHSNHAKDIEREGMIIFSAAMGVAEEMEKLKMPDNTESLSDEEMQALQHHESLEPETSVLTKQELYKALQRKRGKTQNRLFEQAKRLGPRYGARVVLRVENTFLAAIDMLRAIKEAGIAIDMNIFPGREARFENYGLAPPENYSALNSASNAQKVELKSLDPTTRSRGSRDIS